MKSKPIIKKTAAFIAVIVSTPVIFFTVAFLVADNPLTKSRVKMQEKKLIDVQKDLETLRIRAEEYYMKHQSLPTSLNEISQNLPTNLSTIDRYSKGGQVYQIIIRDRRAFLYSIGPDKTDDKALVIFDPKNDPWILTFTGKLENKGDIVYELNLASSP